MLFSFRNRPYYAENTGSHQNSEVKLHQASVVLRWGTTREVGVLIAFIFFSFPLHRHVHLFFCSFSLSPLQFSPSSCWERGGWQSTTFCCHSVRESDVYVIYLVFSCILLCRTGMSLMVVWRNQDVQVRVHPCRSQRAKYACDIGMKIVEYTYQNGWTCMALQTGRCVWRVHAEAGVCDSDMHVHTHDLLTSGEHK